MDGQLNSRLNDKNKCTNIGYLIPAYIVIDFVIGNDTTMTNKFNVKSWMKFLLR